MLKITMLLMLLLSVTLSATQLRSHQLADSASAHEKRPITKEFSFSFLFLLVVLAVCAYFLYKYFQRNGELPLVGTRFNDCLQRQAPENSNNLQSNNNQNNWNTRQADQNYQNNPRN